MSETTTLPAELDGLIERAERKSGMLRMGERIEFGSDADVIDDLVSALRSLKAERDELVHDIDRYVAIAAEEATRAEAAEHRITALEKERDEFRTKLSETIGKLMVADARLAEADRVIAPFAEVAEWDIGDSESDDDIFRPMDGRNAVAGLIRVGHLRAARAYRVKGWE